MSIIDVTAARGMFGDVQSLARCCVCDQQHSSRSTDEGRREKVVDAPPYEPVRHSHVLSPARTQTSHHPHHA